MSNLNTDLTFEEEQKLKLLANQHGFTLYWTADGKIDPAQVLGFRIGGLIGSAIEQGASDDTVNKAFDMLRPYTGADIKIKK